jgi:alkanesulfonate monooxygenase SsuD/methylene tetrahydromethanopterin reductase-like flavin-dependent oxidoreductase (luciferase family)
MQVGLRLPRETQEPGRAVREVGLAAEELGFHSVWLDAHTALPAKHTSVYPLSPSTGPAFQVDTPYPEPFVALGVVAGLTKRIRLGTGVLPNITLHPLTLAKAAGTLDALSDGRLELGLGAGWLFEEAAILERPADHPYGRLTETIEILQLAWSQHTFSYEGKHYKLPEVGVYPQAAQGAKVPFWIGGIGPAAIRLTQEKGAGLYLSRVTPEILSEFRAKTGPDVRIALNFPMMGSSAAELRERALAFKAAGATLIVANPGAFEDGRALDRIKAFSELLPELQA